MWIRNRRPAKIIKLQEDLCDLKTSEADHDKPGQYAVMDVGPQQW